MVVFKQAKIFMKPRQMNTVRSKKNQHGVPIDEWRDAVAVALGYPDFETYCRQKGLRIPQQVKIGKEETAVIRIKFSHR